MDGLEEKLEAIGPKLRQFRRERNMSLQQLADRSGVSVAAIHRIERNGMMPTVATLLRLASALDRPMSHFVEEQDGVRSAVFIPAAERPPVFTSKRGIDLRSISGPYGRFFIHGAFATVIPHAGSGSEPMVHPGEELVHVLSGTLVFNVEGNSYVLGPGDSLHFRTDRPHLWQNPGDETAEAIWLSLRTS